MDNRMPGIAADIDKTKLREAIKRKNRDLRLARDAVCVDPVDVREMLEHEKRAVIAIDSKNNVLKPAARKEVIITTGFDRIRKELANKDNVPQVDLSESTPDRPPRNEYDDIDGWGLKSVNEY
jgi:hypothetical protein